MPGYPILNKANEAKAVGNGPVVTYKLSEEELAKYRGENQEMQKPNPAEQEQQEKTNGLHNRKYNITKEFLEAEIAAGKSQTQIEREQGMRPGTLYYYLKKYGIKYEPKRGKKEPQPKPEPQQAVAVTEQKPEPQQDDIINHPAHYLVGGIETIEFIRAKLTAEQFEGYLIGNTLKYLSRYRHKNGMEDLQKAAWYLTRLIKEMGGDAKWTS